MGQYSMNAYDADIYIRQFKGLISNGNDPDGNLEYAVEAKNVDTTDGFLQPAADPVTIDLKGVSISQKTIDDVCLDLEHGDNWGVYSPSSQTALINKIYDYLTGSTVRITDPEYVSKFRVVGKMKVDVPDYDAEQRVSIVQADLYVFSSGCGLMFYLDEGWRTRYGALPVKGILNLDGTTTTEIPSDETWDYTPTPPATSRYKDLRWAFATYQGFRTHDDVPPGTKIHGVPTLGTTYDFCDNAMYLSCKERGLYVVQPYIVTYSDFVPSKIFGVELYKIETPENFDDIAVFGERLWGCSGESLYYSAPYKPYDWQQNNDHPADGAGEISEPNWDGDYFTGLSKYGDSLVAFKIHRTWKVTGSDISSNYITEQYGFGTEFPETVVSSGERLYMASANGLAMYDGSTVRPLMQENLRNLWSKVRQSAMHKMRAFLYENRKYCLAVPADSDENNTLIVYDTIDGTVFFYENMNIEGFMNPLSMQEPIALFNEGNRSVLKRFDFNAWEKDLSGTRATRWMTPWIELGRKDIQKGGHDFYFTPEVKGENAVTFTISFQTEKKTKTKQYTVQPMTSAEIAAGKQGKTKRLHFGGTGRRFRIIIETPSGVDAGKAYKWRLYGGIHLITEIDKD